MSNIQKPHPHTYSYMWCIICIELHWISLSAFTVARKKRSSMYDSKTISYFIINFIFPFMGIYGHIWANFIFPFMGIYGHMGKLLQGKYEVYDHYQNKEWHLAMHRKLWCLWNSQVRAFYNNLWYKCTTIESICMMLVPISACQHESSFGVKKEKKERKIMNNFA